MAPSHLANSIRRGQNAQYRVGKALLQSVRVPLVRASCFHEHKVGRSFLIQCNCEIKLLDLKRLDAFYKNILAVSQELNSKDPMDTKEIQRELYYLTCSNMSPTKTQKN